MSALCCRRREFYSAGNLPQALRQYFPVHCLLDASVTLAHALLKSAWSSSIAVQWFPEYIVAAA